MTTRRGVAMIAGRRAAISIRTLTGALLPALFVLAIVLVIFAGVVQAHAATPDAVVPRLVVQTGHLDYIAAVAFSPDDRWLVSASGDRTLKIWDFATERELRTLSGHKEAVSAVAYAADGKTLASGDRAGAVHLWDPETGDMRSTLTCAGTLDTSVLEVKSLSFSPDGKSIAGACADRILLDIDGHRQVSENLIVLWDVVSGKTLQRFVGHTQAPTSVNFSADGSRLLSSGSDGSIRQWDVRSGKEILRMSGHRGRVAQAIFSPDMRWIASAGDDHSVRLWDARTGLALLSLNDGKAAVAWLSFAIDGHLLAAADRDGFVRMWALPEGRLIGALPQFKSGISGLAFTRTENELVISDYRDVWRWDLKAESNALHALPRAGRGLRGLALTPDGQMLAGSNAAGGGITLWNLATGQPETRLDSKIESNAENPGSLAFSPDGKQLASASEPSPKIWRLDGAGPPLVLAGSGNWQGQALAYSPDGKLLASGGESLSLWDPGSGNRLAILGVSAPHSPFSALAFSHSGADLVTVNSHAGIDVWNLKTAQKSRTLEDAGCPASVAFFRNDRILASGNCEGTIKLWDVDAGKKLVEMAIDDAQNGNGISSASVASMTLSGDGQILASAHDDNAIRLWDLSEARLIRTLVGHTGKVKGTVFTPDNKTLFSASMDGSMRAWRVADGTLLATMVSFADGRWAVTDPQGRFDVADLEDMPYLHWIMPDDPSTPLPLEIFMRDYYEPRLLVRILNGEKFKPVRALAELKRVQAEVRIVKVAPAGQTNYVDVTVEAAGAARAYNAHQSPVATAAHDLRLFRNGQMVGFVEGRLAEPNAKVFRQTFRVQLSAGKAPSQFSAYAFNDDRVKSRTAQMTYVPPTPIVRGKPRAYLITIGVNRHQNPAWDLNFAATDARQVGLSLSARLEAQHKFDAVVTLPLISEAGGANLATKANLQAVLSVLAGRKARLDGIPGAQQLRQASPDDLVLISFSGHGFDQDGLFYLVTTDTGEGADKKITPTLLTHAVSSDELALWLRDIDAGDMAMIVDACHSAASVGDQFKPGPMGSRGLGQIAFDKGMRILAASQADDVALESDLIKQGLLSYALVQNGLEAQLADFQPRDSQITLAEWLNYGVRRVPSLAAELKAGNVTTARGAVLHLPPGVELKARPIQQPALFDFTKGRRDVLLVEKIIGPGVLPGQIPSSSD